MNITIRKEYLAKETRDYILVSYVIDGEIWLYDLGGIYVSYISHIPFERLDYGYTTECRLGMRFVTWCIVKLDFYVTLCRACCILIVANYISHMGIKIISWIWLVGAVINTSDFSDLIQINCLFLPSEKYCSLKPTQSSKIAFLITEDQIY